MRTGSVTHVSDAALLARLDAVFARERGTTVEMLLLIAGGPNPAARVTTGRPTPPGPASP